MFSFTDLLPCLGIDLGTANTLVYMKDKGVIINEPTVVAMKSNRKEILAVGEEARRMIGRTPGGIMAVRPLKDGVIADFAITETLLKYFIRKAAPQGFMFLRNPRVLICVPSGITEVERRAVEDAAHAAGARDVALLEEPMAAAMGAGLDVNQARGCMIVDIGGGTTEIAVISLGGIVLSRSLRVGGNHMDEAIARYVKVHFNMIVGESSAEQIKITLGSAVDTGNNTSMEVRGRDGLTGLPKSISVGAAAVREALAEPVQLIVDAVKAVLEQTPPELSGDIVSPAPNSAVLQQYCGGKETCGDHFAFCGQTGIFRGSCGFSRYDGESRNIQLKQCQKNYSHYSQFHGQHPDKSILQEKLYSRTC
jgi:rod shape-determining protein MreB